MIIRSEKTGKEYATVDECLAAEKKYDEAVSAQEKQKKLREEAKEAKRLEVKAAKENIIRRGRSILTSWMSLTGSIPVMGSLTMMIGKTSFNIF